MPGIAPLRPGCNYRLSHLVKTEVPEGGKPLGHVLHTVKTQNLKIKLVANDAPLGRINGLARSHERRGIASGGGRHWRSLGQHRWPRRGWSYRLPGVSLHRYRRSNDGTAVHSACGNLAAAGATTTDGTAVNAAARGHTGTLARMVAAAFAVEQVLEEVQERMALAASAAALPPTTSARFMATRGTTTGGFASARGTTTGFASTRGTTTGGFASARGATTGFASTGGTTTGGFASARGTTTAAASSVTASIATASRMTASIATASRMSARPGRTSTRARIACLGALVAAMTTQQTLHTAEQVVLPTATARRTGMGVGRAPLAATAASRAAAGCAAASFAAAAFTAAAALRFTTIVAGKQALHAGKQVAALAATAARRAALGLGGASLAAAAAARAATTAFGFTTTVAGKQTFDARKYVAALAATAASGAGLRLSGRRLLAGGAGSRGLRRRASAGDRRQILLGRGYPRCQDQ